MHLSNDQQNRNNKLLKAHLGQTPRCQETLVQPPRLRSAHQCGSQRAGRSCKASCLKGNSNQASAEICQSFADIIQGLFLGTPASFEAAVEPFNPDADMKAAATQLKTLVDFLPKNTKDSILKLMVHGFLHSHCLAVDCP
uniref:Uteroglobin n=1 Tax=Equus caballus TaxID=9796 RepID=F7B739_HORSE